MINNPKPVEELTIEANKLALEYIGHDANFNISLNNDGTYTWKYKKTILRKAGSARFKRWMGQQDEIQSAWTKWEQSKMTYFFVYSLLKHVPETIKKDLSEYKILFQTGAWIAIETSEFISQTYLKRLGADVMIFENDFDEFISKLSNSGYFWPKYKSQLLSYRRDLRIKKILQED